MKALTVTMDKFMELKREMMMNPDFSPEIYDLVEYQDDFPDFSLVNENWVKVKVALGGICGSDMHIMALRTSTVLSNFTSFPAIPGHETVGEIVEIGTNVEGFFVGERVICDTNLGCEVRGLDPCPQCQEGDYNLCSNLDKGDIAPGVVIGLCKDVGGSWGEYLVVHKSQLYKLPENLTYEQAIIAEPIACTIRGVLKIKPKRNDTCVVIGGGMMGLATIATLKALSDCKIISVVKYKYQGELATKLGSDEVHLIKKDRHLKKIGRELGCRIISPVMEDAYPVGGGAEFVIDSVGNPSSIHDSLRLVKPKGTLLLIGYPSHIQVDWTPIMAKEITITASNIFSYDVIEGETKPTMEIALELLKEGKINASGLVTHKFKLEDYKEALQVADNKSKYQATKVVFEHE